MGEGGEVIGDGKGELRYLIHICEEVGMRGGGGSDWKGVVGSAGVWKLKNIIK